MPALALEAVDLVALCAILLLMGMLIATRNTFNLLAVVLDVSILGARPFHGLAVALENTIIAGCNAGIKALGSVAHDLWAGLLWAVDEMVKAIMAIPNGVHAALNYLWDHAVPTYVKASIAVVNRAVNAVDARVDAFVTELGNEAVRLDALIKSTASSLAQTLRRDISNAIDGVRAEVKADVRSIRAEITHDINTAVAGSEAAGAEALGKLRAAEDAAIGALKRAEGATAAELRDFIGQVPLTDIAAAIAAVPLLMTAVNILEAETGLGRAECRAKVKNICGTDPSQWASLVEGLVLVGIGFNIEELVNAVVDVASTVVDSIEGLIA
jgi:hypothetical protein